jgi:Glycosyl hydrolase-like 10
MATDRLGGRFYAWTSVETALTDAEVEAKYREYKSHGLDGVFVGGGIDDREFHAVKAAGLELHTWTWTTNRGDHWIRDNHPEWYMVSRSGKSCYDKPPYVDYYRWVSPVNPGVKDYLAERVQELAGHPLVDGVHFDYVRYPDVILPRGLWEQYGLDQSTELPDYDFSYDPVTVAAFQELFGRDPREIADPAHDQEWLHFRYDSVTRLVESLTHIIKSHGKAATAAVFPTPSMARKICRQDWDKWPLDGFFPMTYHSFYLQPTSWIGDCVLENIQAVTSPVFAGLFMPDFRDESEFRSGLDFAVGNGARGVSLFGIVSPSMWDTFEQFSNEPPVCQTNA